MIGILLFLSFCAWAFFGLWISKTSNKKEEKDFVEYHLDKKRRYPIQIYDGSTIIVEEEDFWIDGSRGCYDHGYVDPPKPSKKDDFSFFQSPNSSYSKRLVWEGETVYARGGTGNSRLVGWTTGHFKEKSEG